MLLMYFPINKLLHYLHVRNAFKYLINSLKSTLLGVFSLFRKYSSIVDKISKKVALEMLLSIKSS